MKFFNTLNFIWNHPLAKSRRSAALLRWLRWQVGSRALNASSAMPFVDSCRLLAKTGMMGATGNIYCGLHEFDDMSFLLHFLRPGELFLDIGANIGSYTILGSGAAGADTICFEPMPSTFECLVDNINLNRLSARVMPYNVAVGAQAGEINMVADQDTMNHIITSADYMGETIKVPMVTIDGVLLEQLNRVPTIIKIDVEGFETDVLIGAEKTLACSGLEVLLIELNGCGASFGYSDEDIHQLLIKYEFNLVKYDGFTRKLKPIIFGSHQDNALYVRDIDGVQTKVLQSRHYQVAGVAI